MSNDRLFAKARFQNLRTRFDGILERREAKYATMFNEAIGKHVETVPAFYPTAGAANYSLLYTILRCITELPVKNSLELGMGQTTLLFDALKTDITSVDHEAGWVERMGERVSHKCRHAPLVEREVHGHVAKCYDFQPLIYDMVVVDGPQGEPRKSRWGSLAVLDLCLGDEFLVIFDDAARIGEQDTIREFLKHRAAGVHLIQGRQAQIILYSPKFEAVKYF